MLPLASSSWDEEEQEAIFRVAKSGRYSMGENVPAFEEAYARYVGTKYCVAVNSGSSANLLMVAAYTLTHGKGTVIVPAVSWATTYAPFQQYGWKLVFVDVDRETVNVDLVQLWKAAEKHEDAVIMAVNLLGNSNEYNSFPRKCHVLEDNCQSMGAEYDGRKTGSFGLMASHSTYFSHHICTMEGGMITTNDEYLYQMLTSLRSHGWTRHLPENNLLKAKVGSFEFALPGYNVRPTEMQAAIGLAQLKKLPKIVETRRDNAKRFPLKTQREIGKSSWFGFAVFGSDVDRVQKVVETRPVVAGNFLRSQSIKWYDHEVFEGTPNADYIHEKACFVGNHPTPIDWSCLD